MLLFRESSEEVEFTVKCTMKKRWADQFLSMLNYMVSLGKSGASREVTFYADGDGDFHPQFFTDYQYTVAEPKKDESGDRLYDAG